MEQKPSPESPLQEEIDQKKENLEPNTSSKKANSSFTDDLMMMNEEKIQKEPLLLKKQSLIILKEDDHQAIVPFQEQKSQDNQDKEEEEEESEKVENRKTIPLYDQKPINTKEQKKLQQQGISDNNQTDSSILKEGYQQDQISLRKQSKEFRENMEKFFKNKPKKDEPAKDDEPHVDDESENEEEKDLDQEFQDVEGEKDLIIVDKSEVKENQDDSTVYTGIVETDIQLKNDTTKTKIENPEKITNLKKQIGQFNILKTEDKIPLKDENIISQTTSKNIMVEQQPKKTKIFYIHDQNINNLPQSKLIPDDYKSPPFLCKCCQILLTYKRYLKGENQHFKKFNAMYIIIY